MALLALTGAGCLDFDAAYSRYWRVPGRCPDAGTGRDAGTRGGALTADEGPGWLPAGAPCDGFGQCDDPSVGQPMGCGPRGVCQPRPAGCHGDGYRCAEDAHCCSGRC